MPHSQGHFLCMLCWQVMTGLTHLMMKLWLLIWFSPTMEMGELTKKQNGCVNWNGTVNICKRVAEYTALVLTVNMTNFLFRMLLNKTFVCFCVSLKQCSLCNSGTMQQQVCSQFPLVELVCTTSPPTSWLILGNGADLTSSQTVRKSAQPMLIMRRVHLTLHRQYVLAWPGSMKVSDSLCVGVKLPHRTRKKLVFLQKTRAPTGQTSVFPSTGSVVMVRYIAGTDSAPLYIFGDNYLSGFSAFRLWIQGLLGKSWWGVSHTGEPFDPNKYFNCLKLSQCNFHSYIMQPVDTEITQESCLNNKSIFNVILALSSPQHRSQVHYNWDYVCQEEDPDETPIHHLCNPPPVVPRFLSLFTIGVHTLVC